MTKSPRVLVVSNSYPTDREPLFGLAIARYTAACERAGARVTIVANTDPRKGLARLPKYTRLVWRALRAARPGRFDVVHAHYVHPTAWIGWAAARRARVPLVLSTPGSDVAPGASGLRLRTLKTALSRASRILVMSEHQAQHLQELLGLEADRFAVVSYGTEVAAFSSRSASDARERLGLKPGGHVVCVTRQVPGKGLDLLIAAAEHLPDDVTVHLVGDGPLHQELSRLAARSHGRVVLEGRALGDDLVDWVVGCDAFVLPSLAEGRPAAVIEALAAGKPVAGFQIAGMLDLLRPGITGFLAPVGSVPGLAAAIVDALNASGSEQVGRAAAAAAYSPERAAALTLEVYEALDSSRG